MYAKLLIRLVVAASLAACSTNSSVASKQLTAAVHSLEQNQVISVIADADLEVPQGAQNLVQFTTFHVLDNVYTSSGSQLLIPRDAIITAVYTNDGINCSLEWQAVYRNYADYRKNYGALALNQQAIPSRCEPVHGVRKGERATMTFMGDSYQD